MSSVVSVSGLGRSSVHRSSDTMPPVHWWSWCRHHVWGVLALSGTLPPRHLAFAESMIVLNKKRIKDIAMHEMPLPDHASFTSWAYSRIRSPTARVAGTVHLAGTPLASPTVPKNHHHTAIVTTHSLLRCLHRMVHCASRASCAVACTCIAA